MGIEVGGLFGLILLVLAIWAIIATIQSDASTMAKVLWIVLVLIFPVIGFIIWLIAGPRGRRT
ncbi:MAG: PLDc N-terminal domain-containing protein [Alphaproteobacteria bacterium]